MAYLAGYSNRKKITVQTAYLDSALTDFPLYVPINADTDIGGKCRADGYDLRFTASDGTTLLSYERVSFAVAVGAATGIFWVKSSLATSPATDIYCYYGVAGAADGQSVAATWTSYARVWHLEEAYSTDAGNYKDALGVGHLTLTDANADSGQGTGIVGNCVDLSGDADFLNEADHADHDPGGAMTAEVWIKMDSLVASAGYFQHDNSSNKWVLRNGAISGGVTVNPAFQVRTASGLVSSGNVTTMSINNLYYLAGTFDKSLASGRIKLYVQGLPDSSANGYNEDVLDGDEGINIGRVGPAYFNGLTDEVRYSKDAKSAEWIKFVYRNITEVDNELTWAAQESFGSDIFFFGANF